jgi:hypothetical protein
VLAVLVAVATMGVMAIRPAVSASERTADYVVMAGVAGLRWEDVSQINTPTLWTLAERGSIASLSVRSAHRPTCPADGWVTLGAGNYAARTTAMTTSTCPAMKVTIGTPDGIGASLPDQKDDVVVNNRDKLPWGAMPGALAESVRCTVAVGAGAAVAAARPFGRVDRYEPKLPAAPANLLASCVLSVVDLGTVSGDDPVKRMSAAHAADTALAKVLAARPARSLLLVAGLSDTDTGSRLHVAIADGPGWAGGWLTSASTGRSGYLQLVDLAPTALAALGKADPVGLFAGHQARRIAGRPTDLTAAVTLPADADREAGAQQGIATWFFGLLVGFQLLLFLAATPLLRRARRPGGPPGGAPLPAPRRLVRLVEVLLVAGALAIPAALAADAVPWWRTREPGLVFGAITILILALATGVVVASRPYRRTLGPMGLVAALASVVVGVDVLTGARLQLNGVAGYSALEGGRYAGVGAVGLGVFTAGTLLAAGCLAQQVQRRWRPLVLVLVGGVGVMIVGSPYLGADASGAVALTAGVCLAVAVCLGGWLTFARLAWAVFAGLAMTSGFALLDLQASVEDRGSLGRFVAQLTDGSAGMSVRRTGAANVLALGSTPLTVLALAAAVFVWLGLLRPWGGLKRLYGLNPAVRAAVAGTAVASVMGGLLNGAALAAAGAAAATAIPLATLASLRVLGHASDRTQVPESDPLPEPESGSGVERGSGIEPVGDISDLPAVHGSPAQVSPSVAPVSPAVGGDTPGRPASAPSAHSA